VTYYMDNKFIENYYKIRTQIKYFKIFRFTYRVLSNITCEKNKYVTIIWLKVQLILFTVLGYTIIVT